MVTAMVSTVSEQWFSNVIYGLCDEVYNIDYWTNSWIPDVKRKPDRLEVYYHNDLILSGDIIDIYKEKPINVFNEYKKINKLCAIGLKSNDTFSTFEKMLDEAFSSARKDKIGNIIFKVDAISNAIVYGLEKKGNIISTNIKKIKKSLLPGEIINKVQYKQIE